MEGPTPVSALIHAATMVTAGVYLIARSAPIYDLTETARTVVMAIGALTLLIGAIAGCAYDDIKKVLAYSTVSQIGYMFLAVGLGPVGYVAGPRPPARARLLQGRALPRRRLGHARDGRPGRHAPVRRALEEAAGHLRHLRPGLPGADRLPVPVRATSPRTRSSRPRSTGATGSGYAFGGIAVLAAGLTAFYMTRLMLMTFFGRARWEDGVHPHESPSVMTVPMVVLAVGSVFSGCAPGVDLPAVGLAGAGLRRAARRPST